MFNISVLLETSPFIVGPNGFGEHLFSNGMYNFVSGLSSKDLTGVNTIELKTFLRQKNINLTENHSCLIIQIPRHLITAIKPDVSWDSIDESVVPIHINKTTGTFISPDLAIGGEWTLLKVS